MFDKSILQHAILIVFDTQGKRRASWRDLFGLGEAEEGKRGRAEQARQGRAGEAE